MRSSSKSRVNVAFFRTSQADRGRGIGTPQERGRLCARLSQTSWHRHERNTSTPCGGKKLA
eukprot:10426312-Prorocentrum_lima.AAC.1